jgi:hypothetical protein
VQKHAWPSLVSQRRIQSQSAGGPSSLCRRVLSSKNAAAFFLRGSRSDPSCPPTDCCSLFFAGVSSPCEASVNFTKSAQSCFCCGKPRGARLQAPIVFCRAIWCIQAPYGFMALCKRIFVIIQPNEENQIQRNSGGLCKKGKWEKGKNGKKTKGLLAFRS